MRFLLSLLLIVSSGQAMACDDICKLEKALVDIVKSTDPEAHKALGLDVQFISKKQCAKLGGVFIKAETPFCSILRVPKD